MQARRRGATVAVLMVFATLLSACGAGKGLAAVAVERAGNLAALRSTRWVPLAARDVVVPESQVVQKRIEPLLSRVREIDTTTAAHDTHDACELYSVAQIRTPEEFATYLRDKGRSGWVYVQRVKDLVDAFGTESHRDYAGQLAVAAVCEAADHMA